MTTQKPEPVAVEQGDIDAATEMLNHAFRNVGVRALRHVYPDDIYDHFARHRLAERARLTTDRSVGGEAGMVLVPLATMNAIHTELACGMAFLGRGPGGTNGDHIEKWASLCSEVADGLAKADALVRPIVHPKVAATSPVPATSEDVAALRHKLWMVACHATGGGIPEIEGIDRSTNDICVQITATRNAIYQAGKDSVAKAVPAISGEGEKLREAPTQDRRLAGMVALFRQSPDIHDPERAAADILERLLRNEEAEKLPDAAIEAGARAMCDRVNYIGDYDENIAKRRSGWLPQARACITAYFAALATPDAAPIGSDDAGAGA